MLSDIEVGMLNVTLRFGYYIAEKDQIIKYMHAYQIE